MALEEYIKEVKAIYKDLTREKREDLVEFFYIGLRQLPVRLIALA